MYLKKHSKKKSLIAQIDNGTIKAEYVGSKIANAYTYRAYK